MMLGLEHLCYCVTLLVGCTTRVQSACVLESLGVHDGRIPQRDIIVSSEDPKYPKSQIGFNTSNPTDHSGWCAAEYDKMPFVEIHFDEPKDISTVSFYYINEAHFEETYMRLYELQYIAPTDSARTFRTYADDIDSLNGTHWFTVTLTPPVIADTVRLVSRSVKGRACFKLELYGCDPKYLCQAGWCQNGGSCVGKNICKCPDGFLGDSCNKTKTDIVTKSIAFVNITNNKLLTTSFTFAVTGTVSVKVVNTTNVVVINGTNSNIKLDKGTVGTDCLNNIDNCHTGFTLSLDIKFGSLVDNTYILSSGGDLLHHKGLALYYNQHTLTYIVTTSNQQWTLTVQYVPVVHVWQKFEITWNTNLGIGLFLNGNLLGTHGRPQPTSATQTAQLCIGCNPGQTSTVVVNMQILQIHMWTVSRTELVNAGIVQAPAVTTMIPVQMENKAPTTTAKPTTTIAITSKQQEHSTQPLTTSTTIKTTPTTSTTKPKSTAESKTKTTVVPTTTTLVEPNITSTLVEPNTTSTVLTITTTVIPTAASTTVVPTITSSTAVPTTTTTSAVPITLTTAVPTTKLPTVVQTATSTTAVPITSSTTIVPKQSRQLQCHQPHQRLQCQQQQRRLLWQHHLGRL